MNAMYVACCIQAADEAHNDPCPFRMTYGMTYGGFDFDNRGNWLLFRSALALLSGQLDLGIPTGQDVTRDHCGQVIAAADYGQRLYAMGVIDGEQVKRSMLTVLSSLEAFSEQRGMVFLQELHDLANQNTRGSQ